MNFPITGSGRADFQALLATGDIQTLMQMVQGERVRLLDAQLVDQLEAVQSRNDQIAKLNDVLSKLNAFATQLDGNDHDSTVDQKKWGGALIEQYELPLNDAIIAAGITDLGQARHEGQRTPGPGERAGAGKEGFVITGTNVICGKTTKSELDAAITKVKGLIDAESNNQQMDMLRLQSLNNKKNESVEILTNTQKKHSDSTSGIIRNF